MQRAVLGQVLPNKLEQGLWHRQMPDCEHKAGEASKGENGDNGFQPTEHRLHHMPISCTFTESL